MRKNILFGVLLLYGIIAFSQDPPEVKLDLLKAPNSPASNLLGFATSDIDKPTDISAFMLSLQSATGGFSKLPANYAIDLSPYYLFSKRESDVTTTGLQSKNFKDIFQQTFVLSFAIRNPDSTEKEFNPKNAYAGVGFKFSIRRGDYDEITKESLNNIAELQDKVVAILAQAAKSYRMNTSVAIKALKEKLENLARGAVDPSTGTADPQKLLAITQSQEYIEIQENINKLAEEQLSKEEQK